MQPLKTFIIAGASSGIGLEIAKLLVQENYFVYGISRTPGPLQGTPHYKHLAYDFTSTEALPQVNTAINGLVYCPGSITLKSVERLSETDLDRDWHLNARSAFGFVKKYKPLLESEPSIVLFSSVAAQNGLPFHVSIAMAKGAIEGLTKALAAEFAPKIRVNAIAPSLTDTPLAAHLLNTEAKVTSGALRHPLQSIGNARNIAKLACYLLLDGSWVSGQVLGINGGLGSIMR
ncbi:SDR family NAD(P)-dependent oxidoreductase [Flavobacterium psychrotrophum]|uniref:SDR family NAD(P)-dependent oxidoreductase n=1 Tax=Flavobacterium psychrotrophum TaxID=2294119 RepID=UPI000E312122|nr:SDR family oxidoreductase [Flavobacterium psychrotrophum]